MIRTGKQIRAARALLGLRRDDLASHAGLHPNAVKYWEAREVPLGRPPHAVERIAGALKAMGAETFTDPMPGVRLSARDNFVSPIKKSPDKRKKEGAADT